MLPRCKISGGFCLLILWFAYANGWRLLGTVLLAAAIHEAGHCGVLLAVGGRIHGLHINVLGAVLETNSSRLSYGRELAAILAGPLANLLSAWVLGRAGAMTAAGAHLVLGGFNLLPLYPLDGGRALELLVSWALGPEQGYMAIKWVGALTAVLLTGTLCRLMEGSGGSLWLLPAAVGSAAAGIGGLLGKMPDFKRIL